MLLDDADLKRLRQMPPVAMCGHCGDKLCWNYCCTHDEYFLDGHAADCPATVVDWASDGLHLQCRTYGKELGYPIR